MWGCLWLGPLPGCMLSWTLGSFWPARQLLCRCVAVRTKARGIGFCYDDTQDAYYSVSNDHWPWEDTCLLLCSTGMPPKLLVIWRPCC